MTGNEIRQAYIAFFSDTIRRHAIIPPAQLIPENDPTTLFTSSGMQPLVPYLKGQPHSMGTRLVDSQPSFRAEDIEEVGDNRHTTFFEMLGNWSLGDYFKKDQLSWFFEFLTKVVGLDPDRLYVTVFEGDATIPRDDESIAIWQELFKIDKPDGKIFTYPAKKNWWSRSGVPANMPPGEIGGPDSEVFYDFGAEHNLHQNSVWKNEPCHVNCDCGRYMEIGNSVFMQYLKTDDGTFQALPKQNVDFGGGLERIAAASNNNRDVFTSDLLYPLIETVVALTGKPYDDTHAPAMRIIADHIRASIMMISQGLEPSNKLQGYILRRLIRRSVFKLQQLGHTSNTAECMRQLCQACGQIFDGVYLSLNSTEFEAVSKKLTDEAEKFEKAVNKGIREFDKHPTMTGRIAFDLLQSFGFPWELSLELALEKGQQIDRTEFEQEFKKHQELSRGAAKGLFKGGLADHSEIIVKYHTTTHLLHAALRQVLGDHVQQMGSNITAERLRFDFKHTAKVSEDELSAVEALINQKIKEDLPVHKTIEDKVEALNSGAMAFFRDKYPDKVSVYTIGSDVHRDWFSKELCGGPHVTSTGSIGAVTIKKEEAVGAGVRRVYITLNQNYGLAQSLKQTKIKS